MVDNQYTYEWTEEDQKRHDEMVRNFSVSMISPVCLANRSIYPDAARIFFDYLVSEVKKCTSSVEMYNKYDSLTDAWFSYIRCTTPRSDFKVSDVLRFV